MSTKTTNNKWVCDICGESFRIRDELRKHKRSAHGLRKGGIPKYKCEYCGELFTNNRTRWKHIKEFHPETVHYDYHERGHKYGDYYCRFCGGHYIALSSLHMHENHCRLNPNKSDYNRSPLTDEHKKKISDGMKLAHKEGRAHNIGEDRWKGKPSYPESWFINMMKNEFSLELGVDYMREMSFHQYSLDFAFPNHKFCIEIDGGQHNWDYWIRSDKAKDKRLLEEGWDEIRYKWIDIYHNPSEFINLVKSKLLQYKIIDY